MFRTKTKSLGLKLARVNRLKNHFSKCSLEANLAFFRTSAARSMSSGCFANCRARAASKLSVLIPDLNSSTKKVASTKSKGNIGSVACNN